MGRERERDIPYLYKKPQGVFIYMLDIYPLPYIYRVLIEIQRSLI